MAEAKVVVEPTVLMEQLRAVIENPEAFAVQAQEIIQLSRKAAVMLEGPFEMFQRLAYSVSYFPGRLSVNRIS